MKRVVITGYGIVCSLGNNKEEVRQALLSGTSGIVKAQDYADLGMRSQVHGEINIGNTVIVDAETIEEGAIRIEYVDRLSGIIHGHETITNREVMSTGPHI